jgi:DMSO/TMAO reductase YedYZ molybdopterin-dependent catalytic subunit
MILSRRRAFSAGFSVAMLALLRDPLAAFGLDDLGAGTNAEELVPFLDAQPIDPKKPMLKWENLTEWVTATDQFFAVSHYGTANVAADDWKLRVEGLVEKPVAMSLDDLKARPRKEVTATLECSGNGAAASFMGAIGNAKWAGTPLAPLLRECGPKAEAIGAVFWGADKGKEKVHKDIEFDANFARSLSMPDALRDGIMLAYEMNGQPLAAGHGFPIRLIVPGWYGIAWVKWLERIELVDRPFENRFMARDYVTLRGEERDGKIVYTEKSVGPMNVKSLVARVTRRPDGVVRIMGAAWTDGTPIKSVEVKIDDGDWAPARLDEQHKEEFCWQFWSYDWKDAKPGEHTLVSRATDEKGRVQPSADDPAIKLKKTYWEANGQYPRRVKV